MKRNTLEYLALIILFATSTGKAQTFNSGSDGSDGDLIINSPGVTNFTATPVHGGTTFNFKTITIAAGSTLKLSAQQYPNPLQFLAQNAVTIAGTLDLSGAPAHAINTPSDRAPQPGGAGGYSGGVGGGVAPLPGNGPGGGAPGVPGCGGYIVGSGGKFTGDLFLVPLVGGSGGGASSRTNGGGGGGAILIASSGSITVSGTINANGGDWVGFGNDIPGAGSGGAVRLVANVVSGVGTVEAQGGGSPVLGCTLPFQGGNGEVRVEAFQNTSGFTGGPFVYASPYSLFLPGPPPIIQVVSIGGVPVNSTPSGGFTVPDVTVNSTAALPVQIQAQNVPVGTTVTLNIFSENGPDQAIVSTALAGSIASSSATASVTLPVGYSRGYVTASWVQ